MQDTNPTMHANGIAFRIAESPEALIASGGDDWSYPPHWSDDPLEAVSEVWPKCIGLSFDSGGAMLLESLGDGVYQLAGSFREGDEDSPAKFFAAVTLAFCATDCRRLLVSANTPDEVQLGRQFWLYPYGQWTRNTDSGPVTTFHLSADVDEWAARLGLAAFHVEARRFGQEAKAQRLIERWACHSGDTAALDFSYLDDVDPAHWRVDVAQVEARHAGFQFTEGATHWIEHDAGCGVPSGARQCTCAPVIGFTNGHQTATVQPGGEVSIAVMH